jgi:hypothetical protein
MFCHFREHLYISELDSLMVYIYMSLECIIVVYVKGILFVILGASIYLRIRFFNGFN